MLKKDVHKGYASLQSSSAQSSSSVQSRRLARSSDAAAQATSQANHESHHTHTLNSANQGSSHATNHSFTCVSSVEQSIINLEVEKSRINREKSILVMNKSLVLYFVFMFVAIIGFINGYIGRTMLNVLIVMGLCVLLIGTVPYVKTMYFEEKRLNDLISRINR